ncbi:MAG: hypothetical protein ACTS3R_20700 [Inquilinaceae bacterium]
MKIGWLSALFPRPMGASRGCEDALRWRRDPLSHPALRTMTQEQLADLQFNPWALERE